MGNEDPRTEDGILRNLLRRVRQLEVHRHPLTQTFFQRTPCIDLYGSGTETDPYLLAPKVSTEAGNQIECTEEGLFVGAAQVVGWDAVVDATATTDTSIRLFAGIGEALSYLDAVVGLTRAAVLVRNGTYTETTNWTNPRNVLLFGVPGDVNGTNGPRWNHGGFAGSAAGWTLHNMYIDFGVKATGFVGTATGWFTAYNTVFVPTSTTTVLTTNSACHYDSCALGGMMNLGIDVWVRDLEVAHNTSLTTGDRTLATTRIEGSIQVSGNSGGASRNWLLPARATLSFNRDDQNRMIAGSSGPSSITLKPSGGITPRWQLDGGNGFTALNIDTTGISGGDVELTGTWGTGTFVTQPRLRIGKARFNAGLTVAAPSASESPHFIEAMVSGGNVDIAGPAYVVLGINGGTQTITLRNQIDGNIVSRGSTISSGAFINGVNMDSGSISVTAPGGGASGTGKPYALDAASTQNVFLWHDRASWPNAGTDAGTGNRFLPEGSAAITVNGHVIEDEATPLTQRANMNFTGAGVTAADSGGKTVVTIPGVGTPTTGWGSITNVTTDRAYDANATTIDELADVLGTLIADLIAQQVIAS